ncbi:MAG TPA: flagellar basal body-associated FliL family protein [Cellvibrio sp.]
MKSFWLRGAGLMLSVLALGAMASGGGNAPAEGVNYIAIAPPLIVNYGGPGKVRYIKAELSLRAENAADATEVIHHLPLIRDRLVSILSAQTEEIISTAEGKEYLRVYALAEINKALLKVEGHDHHEEGHGDDHDKKNAVATDSHAPDTEKTATGHADTTAPALPSAADVTPVKGPASDLFFNNFVVQK